MDNEKSIQHKPAIRDANIGFDDNGNVVPMVLPPEDPEHSRQADLDEARAVGRDEALKLIFAALFEGSAKPMDIGLKVHLLAFAAGLHPHLPQSQSELAAILHVSNGTITNLKARFCKASNVFKAFFASPG